MIAKGTLRLVFALLRAKMKNGRKISLKVKDARCLWVLPDHHLTTRKKRQKKMVVVAKKQATTKPNTQPDAREKKTAFRKHPFLRFT